MFRDIDDTLYVDAGVTSPRFVTKSDLIDTVITKDILAWLSMPHTITLLLLFIAAHQFHRRAALARCTLLMAIVVLFVFSLPVVSNALIIQLESRYPSIDPANAHTVDALVLLGGSVSSAVAPRQHTELNAAGDRLLLTLRLYQAGVAPVIVLAGGNTDGASGSDHTEADNMRSILSLWGIPADALILETDSVNTQSNAALISGVLKERDLSRIMLVTSAMHMPRAMQHFRNAGLTPIAAPANHLVSSDRDFSLADIIPDAIALSGSSRALREYVALAYLQLRQILTSATSPVADAPVGQ